MLLMWENRPQCDPLPNVGRDLPIYITGMEGREDVDIAKNGDGPPAGGKRRLIRREGFASRISKNARPHDPGGGGTTRFPVPQITQKTNLRKTPMDMNTNRNVKLMQVSSKVAEKASSDGTTNKQCRPVHRQSTETTVTDASTNFADKPKPTLYQRPAVAAEEARTDGTIDVQCRSNNHDYMKTTVMNLPTDFVKVAKPTLSRVSPVGAHTDGTRIVQYHSDDQNSMMTTIMQMPMDFLEIPEPSLPRGFLELAEEAKHVDVGSGQSCYTEEVQSQEAGLTRPVLVTIIECSSPVPKEGAMIAPGISTESIPPIFSAGRRYPVDQLGLVGPWDKTEQSVLTGADKKNDETDPSGPVGTDVSFEEIQPVAEGPVGQYITHGPVGPDGMLSMCDSDQPMDEGPVGLYVTRNPVGSDGMLATCASDQPVADGPVGPSGIVGPVDPIRMFSQSKPDQPVAVGPVGWYQIMNCMTR